MLCICSVPFASYSIVCLGVSGHVIVTICLMVCIKDEYLIEVSFLKYSGLLDYLVYCFPQVCIGWKSDRLDDGRIAETCSVVCVQ
jgi:hypothetical protein